MGDAVQTVIVGSGEQKLCIEVAGAPDGRPVLVSAGTPNSRHLFRGWIDDARARGIRLIGYDRPGYGGSDRQSGYRVADTAEHIRAIASSLEIERLAVWGYSGGGPHALACAALLPELVAAVATIGSVAPYGAPGLDFFSGMGEENVEDVKLFFEDPAGWQAKTEQEREELLETTPAQLLEAWQTLLSPVDAQVLTGEYAEYVINSHQDGLSGGAEGWCDDGVAHLSDWGFELSSIQIPVKILQGEQDRFVPPQHGRWLADHIPTAEGVFEPHEGHLTLLVDGVAAVHDWLLRHF